MSYITGSIDKNGNTYELDRSVSAMLNLFKSKLYCAYERKYISLILRKHTLKYLRVKGHDV